MKKKHITIGAIVFIVASIFIYLMLNIGHHTYAIDGDGEGETGNGTEYTEDGGGENGGDVGENGSGSGEVDPDALTGKCVVRYYESRTYFEKIYNETFTGYCNILLPSPEYNQGTFRKWVRYNSDCDSTAGFNIGEQATVYSTQDNTFDACYHKYILTLSNRYGTTGDHALGCTPTTSGGSCNISLPSPGSRSGYTFKGWTTSSSCSSTSTYYAANTNYPTTSTQTLYDCWTSTTYTLTYNCGSGVTCSNLPVNNSGPATKSISTTIPTRSGYTFKYWTTGTSDSGAHYHPTCSGVAGPCYSSITLTSTTQTLYAQWQSSSGGGGGSTTYTLKYNCGSGVTCSNLPGNNSGPATKSISTTIPTRSGYTFKYWTTGTSDSGTHYHPTCSGVAGPCSSSITLTSTTQTLYAQWQSSSGGGGGTTSLTCAAGKYVAANATSCSTCTVNYYCPGGTFTVPKSSAQGRTACPSGTTSPSGSDSASDCVSSGGGGGTTYTHTLKYSCGTGIQCAGLPADDVTNDTQPNVTKTISSVKPTRTGYTFSYWKATQGTTVYSGKYCNPKNTTIGCDKSIYFSGGTGTYVMVAEWTSNGGGTTPTPTYSCSDLGLSITGNTSITVGITNTYKVISGKSGVTFQTVSWHVPNTYLEFTDGTCTGATCRLTPIKVGTNKNISVTVSAKYNNQTISNCSASKTIADIHEPPVTTPTPTCDNTTIEITAPANISHLKTNKTYTFGLKNTSNNNAVLSNIEWVLNPNNNETTTPTTETLNFTPKTTGVRTLTVRYKINGTQCGYLSPISLTVEEDDGEPLTCADVMVSITGDKNVLTIGEKGEYSAYAALKKDPQISNVAWSVPDKTSGDVINTSADGISITPSTTGKRTITLDYNVGDNACSSITKEINVIPVPIEYNCSNVNVAVTGPTEVVIDSEVEYELVANTDAVEIKNVEWIVPEVFDIVGSTTDIKLKVSPLEEGNHTIEATYSINGNNCPAKSLNIEVYEEDEYIPPVVNPSTENNGNANTNPQTGSTVTYIVITLGLIMAGCSYYYFKKTKEN